MVDPNRPLVSVLIPCYNAEKWVGAAIQSALDQTYSAIEVLVMDDGSTDGSLSAIKSYGSRIRWRTGPNRGANFARNRLLEMARGEYIQFFDADDWLFPDKIKSQMEVMLSKEHHADVVFSDFEIWNESGSKRLREVRYNWYDQDHLPILVLRGIITDAPLHRRECLMRIGGFREDLPCSQEYEMHIRLALSGAKFRYLPGLCFVYRKVSGSISATYSVRRAMYRPEVLWPIYRELERTGRLTEEISILFSRSIYRAANRLMLSRETVSDTLSLFEEAKKMHPAGGLYGSKLRVCLSKVIGITDAARLIAVASVPLRKLARIPGITRASLYGFARSIFHDLFYGFDAVLRKRG